LLGGEPFLATACVVHRVGQVFGGGDPLAHFAALCGHGHQRLDASRGDAQGDLGPAGALLDPQHVTGAETRGFASLAGGLQARPDVRFREQKLHIMLIGEHRAATALFTG